MNGNQISGILAIILGLIFIICPIFSTAFASMVIGLSLLFLGIFAVIAGITDGTGMGGLFIVAGILAIIFGFIFTTNILAIPVLVALQFYIIGFLMILMGVSGLFAKDQTAKILSILIIILAIVMIVMGALTVDNPVIAPILLGISLIVEGANLAILKV